MKCLACLSGSLPTALFLLVSLSHSAMADAASCRWRVEGRIVDSGGVPLAGLRVKIKARWSQPRSPWNDVNWHDPVTDDQGIFSGASRQITPCTTKRDIQIMLYKGTRWVTVKRLKKQSRGTIRVGTVKADFFIRTEASPRPNLNPDCSDERDEALAKTCRGDANKCLGSLRFSGRTVPYYRSHALNKTHRNITRAVVVIHGNARTAESYFKNGLKGVTRGCRLDITAVIAPHFQAKYPWRENSKGVPPDTPKKNAVYWPNNSGWKTGGDSSLASGVVVSSFEVVDRILSRLGNRGRFPKLETIVVIGHSAGGQFVQRYAGANRIEQTLPHLNVKYVVANPSSYAYLNNKRLLARSTSDWKEPTTCAGYNQYRYGLAAGLNRYVAKTGARTFKSQYRARKIVYFLGTRDTKRDKVLDMSCQADAQGKNRYLRGYNMLRSMNQYFPGHRHELFEINAKHSGGQMLKSATGAWLMTRW